MFSDVHTENKQRIMVTNLLIKRIVEDNQKFSSEEIQLQLQANELTFNSTARSGHSLLHALCTRPELCTPAILAHIKTIKDVEVEIAFPTTNFFLGHMSFYYKPLNLALMHDNLPMLNFLLEMCSNPFIGVNQGSRLYVFFNCVK